MATRRYKSSPGQTYNQVVEEVGAAANSDVVELTVDLATTKVNSNGSTRTISKHEVLECIDKIRAKIMNDIWPPA
jgi:hypothetical protein